MDVDGHQTRFVSLMLMSGARGSGRGGSRIHEAVDTHAGHANEDAALQRRLAHERSLVQRLRKPTACRRVLRVIAGRETIEVSDGGRCVGGEQCACLSTSRMHGSLGRERYIVD